MTTEFLARVAVLRDGGYSQGQMASELNVERGEICKALKALEPHDAFHREVLRARAEAGVGEPTLYWKDHKGERHAVMHTKYPLAPPEWREPVGEPQPAA